TNDFEGEVKSSSEGEAFWVKRAELDTMPLANTFEHMLKIFEDDSLEELFSYKENGNWQFEFLG
ncbi:MAG: DNA mismatch repair protein MutT, partial [Clostridia bacterium]|nr:DNA mismatch repair protein MutT [Clostridia bacterium]